MRSPSRSAPAPVVTIFSPSLRPDDTSTSSAVDTPDSIGWNVATLPSRREEDAALAADVDDRARRDDQRVLALVDREVDLRVHAGLQPEVRVRDLDLDLRGSRRRVENRRDVRDASVELLSRKRVDLDVGGEPTWMRRRSLSTTLATSRTVLMSTSERNAEFGVTQAPGSSSRFPTNPFTGEVIVVFDRLIFSSSSRASPRASAPGPGRPAPPRPDTAPRCRRRSGAGSAAVRTGSGCDRGWSRPA